MVKLPHFSVATVVSKMRQMVSPCFVVLRSRETIGKQREQLAAFQQRLQAMHEGSSEAFIVIDRDGICRESLAKRGQEILGMDPKGKSIDEVLRVGTNQIESVRSWFQSLYEERSEFQSIAERGPKTFEFDESNKVLKFRYNPMRDEDGTLNSVIVIVAEISTEAAAAKEMRLSSERAEMILRIQANRASFRPFLSAFEAMLSRISACDGSGVDELLHEVRLVKEGCLLFGISSLVERIYETEVVIRESGPSPDVEFIRMQGGFLEMEFKSWRIREMGLFVQLGVFADETIEIPLRKISDLKEKYSKSAESSQLMEAVSQELLSNELGDLLRDFELYVQSTAVKLAKQAKLDVAPESTPLYLPPHLYLEVVRSLVHLFNNSLDHGIETPEVRRSRGKPEAGTIRVRYQTVTYKEKPWIQLAIEDDGGGLDLVKLRQVIEAKGTVLPAGIAPLELAMCIFGNGVSTSDEATQISGQGVGMGAVRAAILKARGAIRIVRTDLSGTRFEILLPIPKEGIRTTLGALAPVVPLKQAA